MCARLGLEPMTRASQCLPLIEMALSSEQRCAERLARLAIFWESLYSRGSRHVSSSPSFLNLSISRIVIDVPLRGSNRAAVVEGMSSLRFPSRTSVHRRFEAFRITSSILSFVFNGSGSVVIYLRRTKKLCGGSQSYITHSQFLYQHRSCHEGCFLLSLLRKKSAICHIKVFWSAFYTSGIDKFALR